MVLSSFDLRPERFKSDSERDFSRRPEFCKYKISYLSMKYIQEIQLANVSRRSKASGCALQLNFLVNCVTNCDIGLFDKNPAKET